MSCTLLLLEMSKKMAEEIEIWRKLADRMFAEIVKDWCWHCGAEMTRDYRVCDLMDEYRQAVINSGTRSE
jgi:hypothetical protein